MNRGDWIANIVSNFVCLLVNYNYSLIFLYEFFKM